jgi:hypothetical protein
MTKLAYLLLCVVLAVPDTLHFGNDLRDAVRNRNVDRVRSLLESGADPNGRAEDAYTPIYFADDPTIVDLLILHGAKLKIRPYADAKSPIEDAAEQYALNPKHPDVWSTIVAKMRNPVQSIRSIRQST